MSLPVSCALEFAWPPLGSWLYWHILWRKPGAVYLTWAASAGGMTAVFLAYRAWPDAASDALSAAVAIALWWWSRRRRDRAPRSYGAKARARLEALVRAMPRWEPRLQPEGARA